MYVTIVDARQHRSACKVDGFGIRANENLDLCIRADRDNIVALDCDSLLNRKVTIDSNHVPAGQNHISI
jgi:hypothetical protein